MNKKPESIFDREHSKEPEHRNIKHEPLIIMIILALFLKRSHFETCRIL